MSDAADTVIAAMSTPSDWWDADSDDPNRYTKGYRSWRYYAQPVMIRLDGKRFQPREFRAPSAAAARQIVAASPCRQGHVVYWSDRENRRIHVEGVVA